ncbi:MAG TPA: hypothetical protein VKR05_00930, partial [Candidatus Cybelea sp.]|nr:hypothetical protein [Candidatus Cybelea sp.]
GMEREIEHRLESLTLDDGVELFYDRARTAGVTLSDDLRDAVAVLVQRLDAIPLAIELAAPQLKSMPPDELLRHLDDRLQLLAMENRGAPNRQQTLEAMHDWSHRLLSDNAQKLFRRLAIFVGGSTLEAAMYVCADSEFNEARLSESLGELIAKSLVIADDSDVPTRYRMLEITRAYAQGRLFESNEYDEAAQSHVHYYTALARRFEASLETMPVLKWQATVMHDAQNFRAALSLALDAGDVESPAAICEALHFWLWLHGPVHAADMTRRIATILSTTMEPAIEAPLRLAHAALLRQTDRHRALESAKRSYELYRAAGDSRHISDALRCTNSLQHDVLGAPSAKLAVEIDHYVHVMLELGCTLRAAELLNNLGVAYAEMLDDTRLQEANICFERAAGLLEARGDRARAGRVIGNSAVTAYLLGDKDLACRWSKRAVEFFDEVPDSIEAGHQWNNLGFHLTVAGRFDEGRKALQRGIEIAWERNDRLGLAEVLESTAQYYHMIGDNRLAARILGCADAMQPSDLARQAREVGVMQELLDALRAQLGDEAYEEERRRGAAIPVSDIVREVEAVV